MELLLPCTGNTSQRRPRYLNTQRIIAALSSINKRNAFQSRPATRDTVSDNARQICNHVWSPKVMKCGKEMLILYPAGTRLNLLQLIICTTRRKWKVVGETQHLPAVGLCFPSNVNLRFQLGVPRVSNYSSVLVSRSPRH